MAKQTPIFRFITVRPAKSFMDHSDKTNWTDMRVAARPISPQKTKTVVENPQLRTSASAYTLYANALAEIEEMRTLDAARAVAPIPEPEATKEGEKPTPVLPPSLKDVLSEDTYNTLAKLRISEGFSLDFIVSHLQKKASSALLDMAQFANEKPKLAEEDVTAQEVQAKTAARGAGEGEDETTNDDGDASAQLRKCPLQPLGIADFRRVEQKLVGYELGEIAHIENVLKGETKNRTTRHLLRLEEVTNTVSERESISERDSQTTDRFELQKETQKTIAEQTQIGLGLSVAASYGPVKATISADYSHNTSSQQSDREAVSFAKETVSRSMERITERVRTERTTKRTEEFEDTTLHQLKNDTTEHTTGVYRWVDKIYEARIVNYGKRLMFEFVITEPAGSYLHINSNRPSPNVNVEKPTHPNTASIKTALPSLFEGASPALTANATNGFAHKFTSHKVINKLNADLWAQIFGVSIDPFPEDKVVVYTKGELIKKTNEATNTQIVVNEAIELPSGYFAYQADVVFIQDKLELDFGLSFALGNNPPAEFQPNTNTRIPDSQLIKEGSNQVYLKRQYGGIIYVSLSTYPNVYGWIENPYKLNNENKGKLPLAIFGKSEFYAINVEVVCQPTDKTIEEWQQKAFNTIMNNYERKLQEYNQALKETQSSFGFQRGTNPALHRQIEQQELKRGCLRWLFPNDEFSSWANWYTQEASADGSLWETSMPGITGNCENKRVGQILGFVENTFDWALMTYTFYPYFYGMPPHWKKLAQLADNDLQFQNFLQSGVAKVLVPIQLGYEAVILQFLETGVLKLNAVKGDLNDYHKDILDELNETESTIHETADVMTAKYAVRTAENKMPDVPDLTWEIRVPTTLVALCDGEPLCKGRLEVGKITENKVEMPSE